MNNRRESVLNFHPEQWGQRRIVRAAELAEGNQNIILTNDGSDMLPHVRTLMLTVIAADSPAVANNVLRWSIDVGVGGANSKFVIDALGTQQLSFPSSKLTIALIAEKLNIDEPFVIPDVDYSASAFIGIGNVASSASHYTTSGTIHPLSGDAFLVPAGATGWRIAGPPSSFDNTVLYSLAGDSFHGDELEAVHSSSDFIPITGNARLMSISNGGAADINPLLIWQLDL